MKTTITIILIIFSSIIGFTQSISFLKQYGLIDRDEKVYSMIITNDSAYCLSGSIENNGFGDCLFLKIDKYGDTIWSKSYGESKSDIAYCIRQTIDGGYIAGGVKNYYMDTDSGYLFGDMWILKLDENGDTVWTKSFYGTYYSYAKSIIQNYDSTFIIAGVLNNSSPNYGGDIWILKLDIYGNIINSKIYNSQMYPSFDRSESIRSTTDGNSILVATSSSNRIWVLKLDSNCDTLWAKSLANNNSYAYATDIQQANDSCYIVIGRTPNNGVLYKLNQVGDTIWSKQLSLFGEFFSPTSVEQTNDDGFIISGDQIDRIGLIKLNTAGDTVWSKMFPCIQGNWANYSASVLQTSDHGYIFSGNIKPSVSEYRCDILFVKMDELGNIVGIVNNKEMENETFSIYPNPFYNETIIKYYLSKTGLINIELVDISGKTICILNIQRQTEGFHIFRFDSSSLHGGIYFCKLRANDFIENKKIILIK